MINKKILGAVALVLTVSLILLPANASLVLNLPTDPVTISLNPFANPPGVWPGTVTINGISGGPYEVNNDAYLGWCSDFYESIAPNTTYSAGLVSSLTEPTPWDKINYLLNSVTSFNMDVQIAIWLLLEVGTSGTLAEVSADIGNRYPEQPTSEALALYNEANSNGGGFEPTSDKWIAVLCVTESGVQDLFIQIHIGREGLTPGFWKNHLCAWRGTGYAPWTSLDVPFDNPGGPLNLKYWTMYAALRFRGGPGVRGAERILLRAAVAALLNAASPKVDYPLTEADVISQVNAALASNNRGTMLDLATQLDTYNNLGIS